MKKLFTKIIIAAVLICSFYIYISIDNIINHNLSDKALSEYYEDMYSDYNGNSDGLTDDELNAFYENLYGQSNNPLIQYDDYSTSEKTVYEVENDNTYTEYMSLNKSKAYYIQDASSRVTYNADQNGDKVTLKTDEGTIRFKYGIAITGAAACFTYTDIKEQGYDEFSGYFGAHYLASSTNATATSFNFRFVCDGQTVYTTKTFNANSTAEYVSINLKNVEVFQLFVDIEGSGTGDWMGMGDPKFTKEEPTPYLYVFDLEFNLPNQVIPENILEFAEAYDIEENDISDTITYDTNYVKGKTGEFTITYYVEQEVNEKTITRSQTVNLHVENTDYSEDWTRDDFRKPYVNYMYHGRQGYPEQKKKLFDLCVEYGLDYEADDWGEVYRAAYGTTYHYRNVDLQGNNIYLHKNDVNNIMTGVSESEPRTFMLFNMDIFIYYSTDTTTGLIKTWGLFCQNLTNQEFEDRVDIILANSQTFLSAAQDDMTYAQKWKYVTDAYNSKVTYTDGANLFNSMGLLKAKCNGNSMGLVFLAQRLNMKSIYASGGTYAGYHAWSYQKLPDDNIWYLTDKLWYTTLGTVEGYTSSHVVSTSRGYKFPKVSDVAYESYRYTYPTIWATFETTSFEIQQGETINLASNLKSYDGIFDDMYLGATTTSYVVKNQYGNTVSSDTSTLPAGEYTVLYKLNYVSSLYDITREYTVNIVITNT